MNSEELTVTGDELDGSETVTAENVPNEAMIAILEEGMQTNSLVLNQPNIIFVGKDREPPTGFYGVFRADLPDAETQKAGFYHPQAGQIIAHRPKLYKRFKSKGDK